MCELLGALTDPCLPQHTLVILGASMGPVLLAGHPSPFWEATSSSCQGPSGAFSSCQLVFGAVGFLQQGFSVQVLPVLVVLLWAQQRAPTGGLWVNTPSPTASSSSPWAGPDAFTQRGCLSLTPGGQGRVGGWLNS